MSGLVRWFVLSAVFVIFPIAFASAAPPASCAHKFVGTWVYPGGTTVVSANGQAYPKCPMCVGVQSWTCSGNTYLFSNSGAPGQFSATLVGANTMQGSGVVATRVGGRAPAPKPAPAEQTTAKPASPKPAPSNLAAGSGQRQSCSDITGTKNGNATSAKCPPPRKQNLAVAQPAAAMQQKAQETAPAPQSGGTPTAADQAALAGSIIDELGRVRSGEIASVPPSATGASQAPDFDLKKADPHRAAPRPPLPEAGQSCVPYFQNMQANIKRNAALCLRDSVLIRSLTDMVEKDISTVDERDLRRVTRNTAPALWTYFDPIDPRWTVTGETAVPNCDLPLTVATQRESFMECARVYLCTMAAATCGLRLAMEKETNQCMPISQACIAANPVPQQMAADPTPPPYQERLQPAPLRTPHRNSTITGPSGPGGGDSSGGVRSAQ